MSPVVACVVVLLAAGTPRAQSGIARDHTAPGAAGLSRGGVFERVDGAGLDSETPSAADNRLRWLIFHLIYTDERLSCYAPGGAMGARFDLFQFEGFPGTQPRGYAVHIVVEDRRVVLMGVVGTEGDRQLAEARVREAPGDLRVENLIAVDPDGQRCPDDVSHRPTTGAHHGD